MFGHLNSLWNSLWNSVSHWKTQSLSQNTSEPITVGKPPRRYFILMVKGFFFSLNHHCFGAAWEFFPICWKCSHGDYAVVLWETEVGSSPDVWNQENASSTVARPQIKFLVWTGKALTLDHRDVLTRSGCWPQGTRPAASPLGSATTAGRSRGRRRGGPLGALCTAAFGARRAAQPRAGFGRAHCSRGAEPRSRGAAGGDPAPPPAFAPGGPAARPRSPPRRAPAPLADSEFSPPWLHN